MKPKDWGVARVNYDSDREVYAWRHDVPPNPSPILRISRRVLEDYTAFVVLYHLDQLKVARAIRVQPHAQIVVVQKGSTVVLDEES